ncbi:Aromatic/aminoadipate aminotransferase 1 [Arachnomyces sp. PD_36]|nr:Aromatic/aminoadipate aminotransferase 1 [Arachnomyces sp. PD_36]
MSPPSAIDVNAPNGNGVAAPRPLTIADVPARRAKTQVPKGIAAFTHSDMFKSAACFTKPKAKRFDHLISTEGKARQPSTLKGIANYLKNPGLLSLGGGLPSSDYFPFEHIDIKVPAIGQFSEEETKKTGKIARAGKHDIKEGTSEFDLEVTLNYGQSTGAAQLLRFVTEHTEIIHNPPYADWHCCLTGGSTSAWDMALRLFCERGDYIITDLYTFSTALETALPMGVKSVGIKMDDEGLLPAELDNTLSNWDTTARGARKPHLLYMVPSGQNPTGATQGETRRKEIYKVAQKHDLIIVEDEPYYFLQMQPYTGAGAPDVPPPATHDEFMKALLPSYLNIDVDGRVVRLESFSKVISPGSRVGWIVGSEQIVERYARHFECSTQTPSGISQIVLFKLLDEQWGHSGYIDWLINLRMEYTNRRDIIVRACEEHLPTSVASWNPPAAGMFHWIKVDWRKHPSFSAGKNHEQIEEAIFLASIDKGVLVAKGSWFLAERNEPETDMFFRATFAAASETEIVEAIKRFGIALRAEFGLE